MEKPYNNDSDVVRGSKVNCKLRQAGGCFLCGPLLLKQQIMSDSDGLKKQYKE
jgi:hypothetical protein